MGDRGLLLYLSESIPSGISLVFDLLVIFCYFRCEELHQKSFTTIVILCVFNICFDIAAVIPYNMIQIYSGLCIFQGTLYTFSEYASILWIGYIAVLIFIDTFNLILNIYKNFWKLFFLITFFSILVSLVPFLFSGYEYVGGHCWISGSTEYDKLVRIFSFIFPVVLVSIFSGITIIVSARRYPRHISKKMIYYSIVISVSYLPLCTVRVLQAFKYELQTEVVCVSYIIFCTGGLINSLIFGYASGIWQMIRSKNIHSDLFELSLPS